MTVDARLAKIEQSVNSIATLVESNIKTQTDVNHDLYTKFDSHNKTNWGVIWPAVGVVFAMLVTITTAFYVPINWVQASLKEQAQLLESRERENHDIITRHDERLIIWREQNEKCGF